MVRAGAVVEPQARCRGCRRRAAAPTSAAAGRAGGRAGTGSSGSGRARRARRRWPRHASAAPPASACAPTSRRLPAGPKQPSARWLAGSIRSSAAHAANSVAIAERVGQRHQPARVVRPALPALAAAAEPAAVRPDVGPDLHHPTRQPGRGESQLLVQPAARANRARAQGDEAGGSERRAIVRSHQETEKDSTTEAHRGHRGKTRSRESFFSSVSSCVPLVVIFTSSRRLLQRRGVRRVDVLVDARDVAVAQGADHAGGDRDRRVADGAAQDVLLDEAAAVD